MCFFSQPALPRTQSLPSANSDDARRRRAQQMSMNDRQQGRAATVLTSPLGDPNFGKSVNRTVLVGL